MPETESKLNAEHQRSTKIKTKNKAFTFTEGERSRSRLLTSVHSVIIEQVNSTMSIAVFCLLPFRIINCISLEKPQHPAAVHHQLFVGFAEC